MCYSGNWRCVEPRGTQQHLLTADSDLMEWERCGASLSPLLCIAGLRVAVENGARTVFAVAYLNVSPGSSEFKALGARLSVRIANPGRAFLSSFQKDAFREFRLRDETPEAEVVRFWVRLPLLIDCLRVFGTSVGDHVEVALAYSDATK